MGCLHPQAEVDGKSRGQEETSGDFLRLLPGINAQPRIITLQRLDGFTFQSDPSVWLLLAEDNCATYAAATNDTATTRRLYRSGLNVVSASTGAPIESLEGQVNLTTLRYNVVRDDSLSHIICDRGGE